MIPKAERDADRAICEAASPIPWHETVDEMVSESRCAGIVCADPEAPAIVTTDSGYYGPTAADAEAIVNAVNRLPLYIADAEEMERRIAAVKARAQEYAASEERADRQHSAGMREALKILRGEG